MDGGKTKTTLTFAITAASGGRSEVITQDIVKIGKDPKSHLRLDDEAASRMHAVVEVASPDDVTLIDLGNEPGTLVNGQRINKCKIKPGDEIRICDTRIVLESAVPATAGAPVAAAAAAPVAAAAPANPFAAAAPAANPFAAAAPAANPFAAAAPAANPFAAAAPAANPFAAAAPAANPFAAAAPAANPFAAAGGHGHGEDDPNAEYTYVPVKSGPDVNPSEVEEAGKTIVDVTVLWGSTILHSKQLTDGKPYYVGEELPRDRVKVSAVIGGAIDGTLDGWVVGAPVMVPVGIMRAVKNAPYHGFIIPAEKLGVTRMAVVTPTGGGMAAVIPQGAKGRIVVKDQSMSIEQARAQGMLQPCSEAPGAEQFPLTEGSKAVVEFNGFTFQSSIAPKGKKVAGALGSIAKSLTVIGGFWVPCALALGGIYWALRMAPGDSLDPDEAQLDKSTAAYMLQLQKNASSQEVPEQEDNTPQPQNNQDKSGGTGTRHKGAEGMMGSPSSQATGGYYQIQGPPDTQEVKIARTRALIESGNYGAIGALTAVFGSTANAPIAFDSESDVTIGRDPNNFNGNLMGDHPGDSFGFGGLGMSGTGPGGGGWGDGIGLGTVGGFGHGGGTGSGMGYGGGSGRMGQGRKPKTVKMIEAGTDIQGRLPPDVIKRIVRANYPRFRACYESGLKRDPGLKGTVSVMFIIDTSGAVESASSAGGTLTDGTVTSCVVGVYRTLSFPEPEGGKVRVTYPIDFQNDE
jgi:hypothetical protein